MAKVVRGNFGHLELVGCFLAAESSSSDDEGDELILGHHLPRLRLRHTCNLNMAATSRGETRLVENF